MRVRVAALTALLTLPLPPASAQTRGVTADDYLAFETLGDPHFSPDGRTIVYTVTHVDQRQNRRVSQIWTLAADGSGSPKPLNTGPQSSSQPRWRGDGRAIAFVSSRAEPGAPDGAPVKPQLWLLPLDGGAPKKLTSLANGVNSYQWSPDGSRLVAVSSSGPSDTAKSPSDVRHYGHANYKFNDSGWFDDKRTHLWVIDAGSGAARQITSGQDWNDTDPQWSPDGTKHRVRLGSDRQGVRLQREHRRLGRRRRRRHAGEDLRPRAAGQLAALVARRPDDRVSLAAVRAGPPEDLAGLEPRRRDRRAWRSTISI